MSKKPNDIDKRIKQKRENLDEIIQDFNRSNNPHDEEMIKKTSRELTALLREKAALEESDENGNKSYEFSEM